MSTLASRIASVSADEVEAPEGSGMLWRVHKVTSADIARVNMAKLRMYAPLPEEAEAESETEMARRIARIADKEVQAHTESCSAVVCAGVTAVQPSGGEWEPISVVIKERDRDHDGGVLHITDLPAGVEDILYSAIDQLHGGTEEAGERLARFREGAGDVAND